MNILNELLFYILILISLSNFIWLYDLYFFIFLYLLISFNFSTLT